ncbi:class C sortase [Bifidobacterium oedipodis]|uniref:Sortase n=1 Tax=Bifidobacterium oedipodis TaxID=2675322 RepID=A0A7Y0EPA8_9BIFI|nr:sortase [Bifidobacterium sp. DSM 109957]
MPNNANGGMAKHRKPVDIGLRCMVVFFVLLLLVGVGLVAYPTVADTWNRMHQSRAVATYIETTDDMGKAERESILAKAEEYNAQLLASAQANQSGRWMDAMHPSDETKQAYEDTLDITGTGIMGYVTIPKLETRLPIYHGTDDGVLQIAVGHLLGSSLPVGGEGSHAVVSGHTGLPSARLLTGLDELEPGDTFAFHVLDTTMTYQVDEINVVLPNDFTNLNIEPGEDLATLITCTPYGINSHRLLVRGHRIANPTTPDETDYDKPQQTVVAITVGCAVLGVIAVCTVTVWHLRRRAERGHHIRMKESKGRRGRS